MSLSLSPILSPHVACSLRTVNKRYKLPKMISTAGRYHICGGNTVCFIITIFSFSFLIFCKLTPKGSYIQSVSSIPPSRDSRRPVNHLRISDHLLAPSTPRSRVFPESTVCLPACVTLLVTTILLICCSVCPLSGFCNYFLPY
ncbi:hypothetical protein F5Y03DRAFT_12796 [Xylaria venustula]|nr:hypothetical protein F5Y03DRAFT_12796 [Xylaria venustula]